MHCGLDARETDTLFTFLKSPKSKIKRLFLDWCPELAPVAHEIGEFKTLEALVLRGCSISDKKFEELMDAVKANGIRLRLLDLYSNHLTDKSVEYLCEFTQDYKWLDSIGLGMNKIRRLSTFKHFFERLGLVESSKPDFDQFVYASKQRDTIVQKNQKLKAVKKPEEPLPYLEEVYLEEATGKYFKKQYPNLMCLNLVGNPLENEKDYGFLDLVLKRTQSFLVVLSYTGTDKFLDPKMSEAHAGKLYFK